METIKYINAHEELLHYFGERAMRVRVSAMNQTSYKARLVFVFRKEILN